YASGDLPIELIGAILFAPTESDLIAVAVLAELDATFDRVCAFDPGEVVVEIDRAIVDITRGTDCIQNSTKEAGDLKVRSASARRKGWQSRDRETLGKVI